MGRRFFQSTMPGLVENLGRIATQMEEEKSSELEDVYVVVGVYQGVIDDVSVTPSHDKAVEIERDLCAKCGVPANPEEREEYYEKNPEPNEVRRFEVELE
ncbi:hypothetical protein AKJ64_00235 [candidate division MSBL1 archaeon SCGC-AAA259E17]|uniref:Uncharacterized protein n=1 Tax=candidate division MSBL1 archaeon SCGC-AAA259E17 TaxID=1698263 RepID=A0A133UHI9_9EURY|nr:hypothetical protein AKJ64_00235 [candidate division MSBL1 archaeon SCGC-AAA259E17]